MKRILSLLVVVAMIVGMTVPAAAADSAKGGTVRLEETSGTVDVKNAAGKAQTVRKSMRLYSGYNVATGRSSSAFISLDDTKVVKLDVSTKVDVREAGKQLEVALSSGQLFFNVTKPLQADETLNIRTSTMVTGIRGSYGWVRPNEMGLMHGHVTVTCRNPYTGEIRVTEVHSGERVYFDPNPRGNISADPKLLEISFVKELIYNRDVPLVVVREMARDYTGLCEPVIADVPTVDVPALLEQLPAMEQAAREQEEAAQKLLEEALRKEEAALVGDDVDQYFETGGAVVFTGHAVSFDTDGGGWVATQDVPDGSNPTIPADPVRPGHTFTGWYSDAACTVPYDFTAPVTSDTTVYAGWTINTYTVTFDANGHGTAPAAQTVDYNTYAAEPAALAETGWTFGGWYTDAACTPGSEWTFAATPVTDDVTLYARWTVETHAVTFEMNGHGAAIAAQTVDYNGYATEPAAPTETGWTFGGWYADAGLTTPFNFAATPITTDTVIYARWTAETHSVSFEMNGHGAAIAAQTVDYNGYATQPADPTETGWTFGGWYADTGLTTPFDFAATPITGDTTVYAKWTPVTYTVSFVMNGHGTAVADQTVNENDYATEPGAPTETGWTFGGWFSDAGLTTAFNFAATPITADTTLYAKWTVNTYTLTYDGNGDDAASVKTENYDYGTAVTVDDMSWIRVGYEFAGWNTAADGTGTAYAIGDPITMTDSVTLYAQWTLMGSSTITLDGNGGSTTLTPSYDYNATVTVPDWNDAMFGAGLTRTGYTFNNWNTSADGTGTVYVPGDTFVMRDTYWGGAFTLYAQWSINSYTVSFEMNGHGAAAITDQTVVYNGYATQPADPTEAGWRFDGWFADTALTTAFDFAATAITADTVVYAKWTQVFGGDYISNAPDGSADLTLDMGDLPDGEAVTLTDMTTVGWGYAGYNFNGWNTAADGSGTAYADAGSITATGDVTLYAQWTYEAVLPATVGYNELYSVYDADDNEVTGTTVSLSAGDHGGAVHTFTVRQPAGEAAADFAIGPNFNLTGGTLSAPQTTLDPVDFTFTVTGGPTTVSIAGICYTGGATVPADGTVIEGWLGSYGSVILTQYDTVSYDVTVAADQSLTVNSAGATEAMHFGQLNNAGTLQVMSAVGADINDTSTNSGSIIVDAGSGLAVNNALTSDTGSSIDNQGTLVVDGANGELNLSGTMVNGTGGTVTVSGTGAFNILTGGIFTNSGAITVTDAYAEFTSSGEFTNESGATVTVNDQAEFRMNGVTVNNGAIELTAAGTEDTAGGIYCSQGSFTNNGSIIIRNNRLAQFLYQMTVLNSAGATITVDAGGKISFMLSGSASSLINEGTIENAGTCTFSTGTTDPIPVNRGMIVNSGELNISSRGLDSYEGTIDNTGTINNGGPLYYDVTNKGAIGGTVTGSGEIKDEPAP